MAENNKQSILLSINGILDNAVADTAKLRDTASPDFKKQAEAEISAAAAAAAETADVAADTEKGSDTDEAQAIIAQYSDKEKADPNMSTSRLRELLAAGGAHSDTLHNYFSGGKARTAKRVDDLYAILDGKELPVTEAEPEAQAEAEPHRAEGGVLSDELPERETFVQASMFGTEEDVETALPLDTGERAEFDEDFEALSEKIKSGEIGLERDETENENQLTLGVEEEAENLAISDLEKEKDKKLKYLFDIINGDTPDTEADAEEDESQPKGSKRRSKKSSRAKKKKKAAAAAVPAFEYTDATQAPEIRAMLTRAVTISRLKLIATVIITCLILYMELGTYTSDRSPFLRPGRYGIIYILADLQLLFFIVMLMGQSFINGLKAFAGFKLTADSVMASSVIAASSLCIASIVSDPTRLDLQLYNLVAAAGASALALVKHLQCIKDKRAFGIVSSSKPKLTAKTLSGNTEEASEFLKYLNEDSELFTVKKAGFVSGFFERTNKRPESEDLFNFLVPVTFSAALALFMVCYLINGSLYSAYAAAVMLFCAATPLTSFFMISLPVISASFVAHRNKAAFIGNAVAEEYAGASVLSFADVEAFRPHLAAIYAVDHYGDTPLDEILSCIAMLYDYIGGPLKSAAVTMLSQCPASPKSIRLIHSAADGICIAMDGKDYYLGKRSFMRHCKFQTPNTDSSAKFSEREYSIMYLAIEDTVVAKIYAKYGINSEFDGLLESMHRAGVCVGVNTLDPNINNELLQKSIRFKKCPVAILKGGRPEELQGTDESVGSGIASISSLHTFLKMFILCDRARHATRSNCIINIAAMVVAAAAVFVLALTGVAASYGSAWIVAFQLLWMLPTVAMSFLLR